MKYLLPSSAELIFLFIFFHLVFSTGKLLNDGDTGYHIRAGDFILQNRMVPKTDVFSLWVPQLPWTAHEWLSEVIMAIVHRYSGLTGIVIFFALIIALTYLGLFKMLRDKSPDIPLALLITAMAAICSSLHWLARPHIFSLALTVIWYSILNSFQYKEKNKLYLLPPLMLLWVNLHGGYIFGLILLLLYAGGNLAAWCFEDRSIASQHIDRVKSLAKVLAACLAVSVLNPHGYRILLFPFAVASDAFLMDNVQEFLSPNFHEPLPFKYLLLAAIGLFALSRVALNWIELGLVLLVTYMALYSARYIPLYAIIIAPILLGLIDRLKVNLPRRSFEWLARRSANFSFIDAGTRGHLWPAVGIVGVLTFSHMNPLHAEFNNKLFPKAAVEFLMAKKIPGNMFNNDEFGDYLIYTAWPEYKVFFDGRSDMYGATLGSEYLQVSRTLPGWEDVLQKHQVEWIFFNTGSVLSARLKSHPRWRLIYSDAVASIFVRDKAKYHHWIAQYSSEASAHSRSTDEILR
ncbi:MAG: hypothetical protein GEU77_04895 [Deltaproteobacteria bacterium]|nr:hypothetical protein [Deltaproteobacteria bacterium]